MEPSPIRIKATTTPTRIIPAILTRVTCIATPLPLHITTAVPLRTANRLTDHTIPPVGAISVTTGFDMLARDWLREPDHTPTPVFEVTNTMAKELEMNDNSTLDQDRQPQQ